MDYTREVAVTADRKHVVALDSAGCALSQIGGKGVGLSRLISFGLPVPDGFIVTTAAYRSAVTSAGIDTEIVSLTRSLDSNTDNRDGSAAIADLFDKAGIPEAVATEIRTAYRHLGKDAAVAVRSSATAEDAADASFAGQQDTYLWVIGEDALIERILSCWASLFTPQAIGYRARLGISVEDVDMAVVVQAMVDADAAGVMMTLNPVNGERDSIYIESAFGLGEAVVRGEVDPDRYLVDSQRMEIRESAVGIKDFAYRHNGSGAVERVPAPPDSASQPTLTASEALALAQLGYDVAKKFGRPMDIEWAIDNQRNLLLLQARPETVWSRDDPAHAIVDPLHSHSDSHLHWARSNLGEAMPGVQTPLSWSMWADAVEHAPREAAFQIGAFERTLRAVPKDVNDRFVRIFHGRPAIQIEFAAALGDRLPGTSGEQSVVGILGRAPQTMEYAPTIRRYPVAAWRLPATLIMAGPRIRKFAAEQDHWYHSSLSIIDNADLAQSCAMFEEAIDHLDKALVVQTVGIFGMIQPLHDALQRTIAKFGADGDYSVLSGPPGGAEMAVVSDIWAASRGLTSVTAVVRRHGFHGPLEGELSSHVWRDDDLPLRAMIDAYRTRSDEHDPHHLDADRRRRHREAENQLITKVPAAQRPAVRLLLKMARERLPLRGIAKRSFLQAFDIGRAAARRAGSILAQHGSLSSDDDVFYLTAAELQATAIVPADLKPIVRQRRREHSRHGAIDLPEAWRGRPEPAPRLDASLEKAANLQGVGVSPGIIEGRVRVLLEPDFAAVAPDEILVAPTTDPSWSSIMFVSAALVVDIGGALSHAAVIARELGLPCVVNTRNGTRVLQTGDLVRVDGATGTITVLESPGEHQ